MDFTLNDIDFQMALSMQLEYVNYEVLSIWPS